MGKEGNRRRREAKREREEQRHASLDENIHAALKEDEIDHEKYIEEMSRMLGPPGPPKDDNVVFLGAPPKTTRKVVDCLGRVVEVQEILGASSPVSILRNTMPQKTTPLVIVPEAPKRRVTIMRDHDLIYPELWMEVFVSPDPSVRDDEARFAQMFARARCSRAKSVLESDLVIFAGGSDVDPVLYGETQHMTTSFDPQRDQRDMDLYMMCVEHGIPMLGVCRGAQFLHIMNGGKLYQDVDNHYGDHKIWDIKRKEFIQRVSSVHHQMCRPNRDGGMEIIATNGDARKRWLNAEDKKDGAKADVEAFFYRDTCCLGVQGHPEYATYNYFTKWVLDLINEYVLCSPDIEWRDGNRRIKTELLEERKHAIKIKKENK